MALLGGLEGQESTLLPPQPHMRLTEVSYGSHIKPGGNLDYLLGAWTFIHASNVEEQSLHSWQYL